MIRYEYIPSLKLPLFPIPFAQPPITILPSPDEVLPIIQLIQMQNENEQRQGMPENKEEAQEYDSFLYKFQQQIIDAWKPVPHTSSNVVLYIILSAICIGLGLGLILSAPNSQEVYVQYDNACTPSTGNTDNSVTSPCKVTFTLTSTLTAPVYFYYGFKGFYQNHRRYMKYFSNAQLTAGDPFASTASSDCGDYYTNQQTFGSGKNSIATPTTALVDGNPAYPCGTISRMYYQLRDEIRGFAIYDGSNNPVPFTQTGIAWPSDIGRHKKAADSQMAFDVTEETWLVWFRPAARSDFYKLNGIINQDMPAGTYTVGIKNQVASPWGSKWISVSKSNYVGNRDLFLGIAFLALGGGCFILLIVFLAKWIAQKRDRQKFA